MLRDWLIYRPEYIDRVEIVLKDNGQYEFNFLEQEKDIVRNKLANNNAIWSDLGPLRKENKHISDYGYKLMRRYYLILK